MADQAQFAEQAMPFMSLALLGRAAHDPQPGRRRGPRAGDLPAGLPRLRRLRGGHEPQGLALPDPHQHVHQHATGPRSAGPTRPTSTTSRTSTSTAASAGSRRPRAGRSAEDELLDLLHRRRGEGGARGAARAVPHGRAARRRRGLLLQGDRRDPRHPDRHGDEPAAPGKKGAAEAVVRLRRGQRGLLPEDRPVRRSEWHRPT